MLTFASVPLLQPDDDQELQKFLDKYQSFEQLHAWCSESSATKSVANSSRAGHLAGAGIPLPNWPDAPRPKINTLYWPATGASRWGHFIGLTTNEISADDYGTSGLLTITDDLSGQSVSTIMTAVATRRITTTNPSSPLQDLYLLVLVDDRFFFQWKETSTDQADSSWMSGVESWSDLFQSLAGELGIDFDADTVSENYLVPDKTEFSRVGNAAVLLDAAAASVGQRVVFSLDGKAHCWNSSHDPFTENLAGDYHLLAGGEFVNIKAPGVTTTFPVMVSWVPQCDGATYAQSANGDGIGSKLIRSSCYAYYKKSTGKEGAIEPPFAVAHGEPENQTKLSALNEVIADDYTGWFEKSYDATMASVKTWKPTGFDDFICWSFGTHIDGMPCAFTRVATLPPDFGVEQNLSQDPDVTILDRHQVGKLDEAIFAKNDDEQRESVKVQIWSLDGNGKETKTDIKVDAWDFFGGAISYSGDQKVSLDFHCLDNRWYFKVQQDESAIVQVTGPTIKDDGSPIEPQGRCIWAGQVVKIPKETTAFCEDPFQFDKLCWIVCIDKPGGSGTPDATLNKNDRFVGKFIGMFEFNESKRPLYVVRKGSSARLIKFRLIRDLIYGRNSYVENAVIVGDEEEQITVFDPWNMNPSNRQPSWCGKVGYEGWAVPSSDGHFYEILWMQLPAKRIAFALKYPLLNTNPEVEVRVGFAFEGRHPDPDGNGIRVKNSPSATAMKYQFYGLINGVGLALWRPVIDEALGAYDIIVLEPPARFINFKLNEKVNEEGSASAIVLASFGGQAPPSPVPVNDVHEQFPNAPKNALGLAIWNEGGPDSEGGLSHKPRYEIANCQMKALFISGTTAGTLIMGGSCICNVAKAWNGLNPGATVTVYDVQSQFETSSTVNYQATYDKENDRYYFVNMDCDEGGD